MLRDLWSDVDWGDLPSWVEALATIGALVAAAIAARYAYRAFDLEQKRETRLEGDRRAEQASLVAGWFGSKTSVPDGGSARDQWPNTRYGVWLRNASQTPVYNVKVSFFLDSENRGGTGMKLLPPSDEPTFAPWPGDLRRPSAG